MQSEPPKRPRPLFLALGLLCVALGYIGVIVPVMPSTVFFLIALWAFKKSSPRFESWLLERSFIGPTLQDWESDKSITLRTKIVAITLIWLSIASSSYYLYIRGRPLWIQALLLAIAISLTIYLATRKTKQK